MTNPSKDKGDRAERAVVAWLTDQRGLRAERIRAGRSTDPGDITWPNSDWLLDVKDQQRWSVQEWWRNALTEAEWETRAVTPERRRIKPLLVLKRPGITNPGRWLAVVHLEDLEL